MRNLRVFASDLRVLVFASGLRVLCDLRVLTWRFLVSIARASASYYSNQAIQDLLCTAATQILGIHVSKLLYRY